MKVSTKFFSLVLVFALTAGTVFAQGQQQMQPPQPDPIPADSVTDADVQQFVEIVQGFQPIISEVNQKQMQIVEEADSITVQKFQQIMQAQQTGQQQNMQLSDSEKRALQRLQPKFQQLRMQVQKQQMQIITESEMSMQRFQRMDATIRSNPDIQQRVQAEMSDTTGTGGNGGGNGGNR
ncbi:MAG: DUF4168 domain-containing protein [Balneolaceae bacterium]|nr:DUF4168 domain-containing protein [Balneolaceae bacterium]